MNLQQLKLVIAVTAALGMAGAAHAKATADELAQIGKKYTCTGAEKAGSADGVAEFTGKWFGAAPGQSTEPGVHMADPYASEKPIVVITAQNYTQYADKLSEGQKAMFKKFPASFKMNIYPSHRDYRLSDAVCKNHMRNAKEAELTADGLDVVTGYRGAALFPFPKTGAELVWNGLMPARAAVDFRDTDLAIVYADGKIQWGKQNMWSLSAANDPKLVDAKYEGISAYTRIVTLLPEREKGLMTKTLDSFNFGREPRQGWQYNPGTRRVRQLPGFGFDMPNPSSGGTLTVNDTRLLNGSPERYNWKIVGKKDIYIPYNGFKLESKAAGADNYAKLLTPGHENPEFVRWELHRTWIVEGKLKEGFRHLYASRTLYMDEDNWQFAMSDNFDARGNLWKFNWSNSTYVPGANIFNQGNAYYHDLVSGTYSAYDLTQARPKTFILNVFDADYAKPEFYSLENLKAGGY